MQIEVFMWIVGILLTFIGALLVVAWNMWDKSIGKLENTLGSIDEKIIEEIKARLELNIVMRDKIREEQRACLQGCSAEWERLAVKLDKLIDDLEDCKDTVSGFEAGLVQRSELKGILQEFVNAVNTRGPRHG